MFVITGMYQSVAFAYFVEVAGPKHLASASGYNTFFTGLALLTLHATAGKGCNCCYCPVK